MNGMSLSECQVLIQDVALELSRLDRRLAKITQSAPEVFFEKSEEAQLPVWIRHLRHRYLQQATLLLLEFAQFAGKERLRRETDGEGGQS